MVKQPSAPANSLVKRTSSKKWERYKLFLLVSPFILFIFIFKYLPLWGWSFAFFQYKPGMSLFDCKFVGLQNFKNLFGNPVMRNNLFRVLRNTFAIQGLNFLLMPVPMLFAIFLSEIKSKKFQKVVQTLTTLPHFISWVIMFSLASSIFGSTGLINSALKDMGSAATINFLTTDQHVWITQALLNLWKSMGWSSIIYFAAIAGLDHEVYEAALVDGASRWDKIRYITIPLLIPAFLKPQSTGSKGISMPHIIGGTDMTRGPIIKRSVLFLSVLGYGQYAMASIPMSFAVGLAATLFCFKSRCWAGICAKAQAQNAE